MIFIIQSLSGLNISISKEKIKFWSVIYLVFHENYDVGKEYGRIFEERQQEVTLLVDSILKQVMLITSMTEGLKDKFLEEIVLFYQIEIKLLTSLDGTGSIPILTN